MREFPFKLGKIEVFGRSQGEIIFSEYIIYSFASSLIVSNI